MLHGELPEQGLCMNGEEFSMQLLSEESLVRRSRSSSERGVSGLRTPRVGDESVAKLTVQLLIDDELLTSTDLARSPGCESKLLIHRPS